MGFNKETLVSDRKINRLDIVKPAIASMAFAFLATEAVAQSNIRQLPSQGRYSVTPEVGATFAVDGKFVKGDSSSFSASADPTVCNDGKCWHGLTVTTAFGIEEESQDFDDVYDTGWTVGVSLNYGLTDDSEVFGRLRYTRNNANDFDFAESTSAGELTNGSLVVPFGAGTTFEGEFDDYKEFGLDIGYRRFFNAGSQLRPFASLEGGLRYVPSIDLDLSTSSSDLGDVEFYDDSYVLSLGVGGGFRYDVYDNMAIGAEAAIRWMDSLDRSKEITTKANDGEGRFDVALTVGLSYQW